MKKISVALILFGLLVALTGCTNVSLVQVDPPIASLEASLDMSKYVIEEEKSEQEHVPIDPDLNYIDTETLMRLMGFVSPASSSRKSYEQYPAEWSFVLVDSRPSGPYNTGHINGAINIPDAQFENLTHLLPEDKDKILIFYCGGLHCPLSASSAKKAIELGYTNVYVYQEGTPFWKAAGNYFTTTPDYVETLLENDTVNDEAAKPNIIIDTRPYRAYFNEHIPGSVSMDASIFIEKFLSSIPSTKDIEIIVYCGGFQ